MNREHLLAFIWLRWRLRVNQLKKGGIVNAVLLTVLAVAAVGVAVGMFVGGFLGGALGMPMASPELQLLIWDGVVVGFLFTWMIGLLTELQRTDALTLDKFLHLPVSPAGVFLVNYLSSLVALSTVVFVPAMVGLLLGQVFAGGFALLLGFPLLAAFILAVTAVTYLFQGWLAKLMSNPRRRRTVLVFVTMGFILVLQLPNFINLAAQPWNRGPDDSVTWRTAETQAAAKELAEGRLKPDEYTKRVQKIDQQAKQRGQDADQRLWGEVGRTAWLVNVVIPPGWLPLGAARLADGSVVPALLGTLGLTLIGGLSLWRAYHTVLKLYTGQTAGGDGRPQPAAAPPRTDRITMVEWRLPGVSEYASAVAAAGMRSLTRAPEAKMMLVVPVILVVVFAGVVISMPIEVPGPVRPLMAVGAAAMVLLTSVQLIGNQFGYDRAGFRAYVLSPIPRREILLGKNLATSPLTLGVGAFIALVVGCVYPMRPDHYPAVAVQLVTMFLLNSLAANALSIAAPIPMAAGAMQPSNVRFVPVLLQMSFMFVFPVVLILVLAPLGVEVLLAEAWDVRGWPVSLVLSVLVLAGVVPLYRRVLSLEGDWLAAREQAILEVVVSKAE